MKCKCSVFEADPARGFPEVIDPCLVLTPSMIVILHEQLLAIHELWEIFSARIRELPRLFTLRDYGNLMLTTYLTSRMTAVFLFRINVVAIARC